MQLGPLPPARRPTPTWREPAGRWPVLCSPGPGKDGDSGHITQGSVKNPFNLLPTVRLLIKKPRGEKRWVRTRCHAGTHACSAASSTAQGVSSHATSGSTAGSPRTSTTGAMTPEHRLLHGHHAISALCSRLTQDTWSRAGRRHQSATERTATALRGWQPETVVATGTALALGDKIAKTVQNSYQKKTQLVIS